ncbi:hypothetical protein QEN19_004420 [Hanseniaspora menglaensis]
MPEQNFFGAWTYQQVDINGKPIITQTLNTRRRRAVSYNVQNERHKTRFNTNINDFNLKYTPQIVRNSDGYKIKTGDCVLYQEAADPLEAWFVYNIVNREIDKVIDVKVIRLVDWEFLEREFKFTLDKDTLGSDKYNELIVFSEFDNIMSDSWFQTINVSTYHQYESEKNFNSEVRGKNRFVRYLFDVANKSLREINFDLFKVQCTDEEGALENFKRLISSGHGQKLIQSIGKEKSISPSKYIEVNNDKVVAKKLENSKASDSIIKEESIETAAKNENKVEKNKNGIWNQSESNLEETFESNSLLGTEDSKVNSAFFNGTKEHANKALPSSYNNKENVNAKKNQPELSYFNSSNEEERISQNKNLFIEESETDELNKEGMGGSSSFDVNKKEQSDVQTNTEKKSMEIGILSGDFLEDDLFPVYLEDFERQLAFSKSNDEPKKRKRGKIVVNPDISQEILKEIANIPNEKRSIKKQKKIENGADIQYDKLKIATSIIKKEDQKSSVVSFNKKIDTFEKEGNNISKSKSLLKAESNDKVEEKKLSATKNVNIKLSEIINTDVLFRRNQCNKILKMLKDFVANNCIQNFIINGPKSSGRSYSIEKSLNTFIQVTGHKLPFLSLDFNELDENNLNIEVFIQNLNLLLQQEKVYLNLTNNDVKYVVLLKNIERILRINSKFLKILKKWAKGSNYTVLFFCTCDCNKKEALVKINEKCHFYSYKQLYEILKVKLTHESKNFNFYTERNTGAIVFTANEASMSDVRSNNSQYMKHIVMFDPLVFDYLADYVFKKKLFLNDAIKLALSTVSLVQQMFYNQNPILHVFKPLELNTRSEKFGNPNRIASSELFLISVKQVKKAEIVLQDLSNKRLVKTLGTDLKFALWALLNVETNTDTGIITLLDFKKIVQRAVELNEHNPVLSEIINDLKQNGFTGLDEYYYQRTFDNLLKLDFVTIKKSPENIILGACIQNKEFINHALMPFSKKMSNIYQSL